LTFGFDYENRYQRRPSPGRCRMSLRASLGSRIALGIVLGSGVAMAGCAGQLRAPTMADAARAGTRWPGTTVADLQQGQRKYGDRCSSCHALYSPEAYPAHKWQGFVEEMIDRAKLAPDDVRDIVRYLVVAAESGTAPHVAGGATAAAPPLLTR
jgi:hypothetical protein